MAGVNRPSLELGGRGGSEARVSIVLISEEKNAVRIGVVCRQELTAV